MRRFSLRNPAISMAAAFGMIAFVAGAGADDGRAPMRVVADPVALELSTASIGLAYGRTMLAREASRFVVTNGVDDDYFYDLWLGTYDPADGDVTILPAPWYDGDPSVASLGGALMDAHNQAWAPEPLPCPGDWMLPSIDVYGTVRVKPIPLTPSGWSGPYFRLKYELIGGAPCVRVTSVGVEGGVMRTVEQEICFDKRIDHALISPCRVRIGKNVRVEGTLGMRYGIVDGELDHADGDPLVMRSDFYGLDSGLDAKLDVLLEQVAAHDADGDGRLRVDHPQESQGIAAAPGDLVDHDQNGFVDDFDLFHGWYDSNADGWVVYDQILANEAGHGLPAEEFTDIDNQMARLIDEAMPDRDGDGTVTISDRALGYRDGILDVRDQYAKVRGRLVFATSRDEWEIAHGESYQTIVNGAIVPGPGKAAATFGAGEREVLELTTDMFNGAQTWYEAQVPVGSADFAAQVADNVAGGGIYTPPGDDTWESIPYGSPGAYDYYQRPVFENMRFENVRIPKGNNGLFRNCMFVGVTYIETERDCMHENWNYAGAVERVDEDPPGSGNWIYEPKYPGITAELSDGTSIPDTKVMSNNIRFDDCTFVGSIAGDIPGEYTHWRNHGQFTNETRFYADADDPDLTEDPDEVLRNEIIEEILAMGESFLEMLRLSPIMVPGWSADVRNFDHPYGTVPQEALAVKLKGTVVAGLLDVRGTADIQGTVIMTFRPVADEGPLFYGGHPSAFTVTIGYLGALEDVDPAHPYFPGFGEITLRDGFDAPLPDGIPWALRATPAYEPYWRRPSLASPCD